VAKDALDLRALRNALTARPVLLHTTARSITDKAEER
jgi:hypothetical protein